MSDLKVINQKPDQGFEESFLKAISSKKNVDIALRLSSLEECERLLALFKKLVIENSDKFLEINIDDFLAKDTESESTIDHEMSHLRKFLTLGHPIERVSLGIVFLYKKGKFEIVPSIRIDESYEISPIDSLLIAMAPRIPSDGDLMRIYEITDKILEQIDSHNYDNTLFPEIKLSLQTYVKFAKDFLSIDYGISYILENY